MLVLPAFCSADTILLHCHVYTANPQEKWTAGHCCLRGRITGLSAGMVIGVGATAGAALAQVSLQALRLFSESGIRLCVRLRNPVDRIILAAVPRPRIECVHHIL